MKKHKLLIAILALSLAMLACSVSFNVPRQRIPTGPVVTEDILVAAIEAGEVAEVTMNFGAGQLDLSPGAEALVEGIARYNVDELKPEIETRGKQVSINNGDGNFEFDLRGIPVFDDYVNQWDLQLGSGPMDLHIDAGAYEGDYELGDLALKNLSIQDGAADVNLSFSEPNLIEMDSFSYHSGASNLDLRKLANANFERMQFNAAAGDYTLDFSGVLQRDARVSIDSGLSNITISVPDGTPAVLTLDGGLTNVTLRGDWEQSGGRYVLEGEGPRLEINVDLGAGNLELEN